WRAKGWGCFLSSPPTKKKREALAGRRSFPHIKQSKRGRRMVNPNASPVGARKDERQDFTYFIEELKSRLDIIQVAELHGMNANKQGQADCFNGHDEKTPSLKFYEDSQSYHCFGCGVHGGVISLVQHVEGWPFMQAVNSLAQEAGMAPLQSNNGFDPELYSRVSDCLNAAAEIYHSCLVPDDSYLAS